MLFSPEIFCYNKKNQKGGKMKKLLIAAVLFIFTVAGCQQKEEPKPAYQFPTGPAAPLQSMEQEKMLKDAVAKDPKNANAWITLGNMMMDSSRFSEAVDAYQKALDIDPKNVNVRVDMGTCYRNLGKPDLAVKEYRTALETRSIFMPSRTWGSSMPMISMTIKRR
jgi:Tfp pilus assembly protein PilF